MSLEFIKPDWPLADKVNVVTTTRAGGNSAAPYNKLNLGIHVGDDERVVKNNRSLISNFLDLPSEPKWLKQIHSDLVVEASAIESDVVQADASFTTDRHIVCAVLTADCLPVVFSDANGDCIAVAHAGWKGLLNGILQKTIQAMMSYSKPEFAWLGPAIGPSAFEVGDNVYQPYVQQNEKFKNAFTTKGNAKWSLDIYQAAEVVLRSQDLTNIYGGTYCTLSEKDRFYSYRRDGVTGRMATLAWKSQK